MCSTTVAENSRKCDYMLNFGSKKGKVFPYSLPSVGPGADPGVQAVSPQVT